MNIIFLDIDGVLCTGRTIFFCEQSSGVIPHNYIDVEAAKYLLSIVRQYGFKIVVSSVWRGNDHFRRMMQGFGFTFLDFHEDWRTSYNKDGRGAEIEDWLNKNKTGEKYVIFEDEPFDLTEEQVKNHLVKCDTHNGILFESIMQFDERIKQLGITK